MNVRGPFFFCFLMGCLATTASADTMRDQTLLLMSEDSRVLPAQNKSSAVHKKAASSDNLPSIFVQPPEIVAPAQPARKAGIVDFISSGDPKHSPATPAAVNESSKNDDADKLQKPPGEKLADTADQEVIVLPKTEISARRFSQIEVRLADLQEARERENKLTEISSLDAVLNSPLLSILGGGSAQARANAAKHRVALMDFERILTLELKDAKTPEERDRIEEDIRVLREMRRGPKNENEE